MMKKLLIIVLVIKSEIMAFNNIIINSTLQNNEVEQKFHERILQKLYQQKTYEAVLILNENNKHEYCHNVMEYFKYKGIPTTIITSSKFYMYRNYYNNQILSIVCMTALYYNILEQQANLLNYMRFTRIIIILDRKMRDLSTTELRGFFKYSHQLKMLNVVVIFQDFYKTHKFIQYTIFPEFKMEVGEYDPNSRVFTMFPERFQNLKGYKLRTIADHTEPRAMEYYNKYNQKVLNGYIGRFVQTISEILNATLYFPLKIPHNELLDYRHTIGYVLNYSLDIPASSMALYEFDDWRDYSYPFEMGKLCLLLPIEKPLEVKEIFLLVLQSHIMAITLGLIVMFTLVFYFALWTQYSHQRRYRWPEILVNDVAIRGVLGQGFIFTVYEQMSLKLIHLMLLLSSLTISTFFGSYLLSFLTQPPRECEIKNYQDLAKSSLKVAISATEFKYIHNITRGSLTYLYPKFHTFPDFVTFSHFRDTFDRRFAYPTITSKLYYYDGLQSYYNKKIFRFSTNMCFNTMLQFNFPLGPNSYFLPRLNEIIQNTLQSGLINYYISKSFMDMIHSGKAIHVNISYTQMARPLYMNDLYWIWLYYMIAILLAILIFLFELIINKKLKK